MTGQYAPVRRSALSPRRGIVLLIGLAPLVILIGAGDRLGSSLGPTIASHWSSPGRPDGFSGTWSSFALIVAIVSALTVASWVLLLVARSRAITRLWVGMFVLVAAVLALTWVVTAVATASALRPDDAVLGWAPALLLAAVPLGALAFWLVDGSDIRPTSERSVEPLPLLPGERVAWIGHTGSRLFGAIGVVVVIGGLAIGLAFAGATEDGPVWVAGAITVIAGLSVLALADVTLSIDERGLRLVSSAFRIPLFRVSLADVTDVVVETIEPARWGGWGLRFSGAGRAYVTGRAEGLVVGRRHGVPTAITIPRAADAAAVLEALIRR